MCSQCASNSNMRRIYVLKFKAQTLTSLGLLLPLPHVIWELGCGKDDSYSSKYESKYDAYLLKHASCLIGRNPH